MGLQDALLLVKKMKKFSNHGCKNNNGWKKRAIEKLKKKNELEKVI